MLKSVTFCLLLSQRLLPAAASRALPSGSILDIINTKEVERMIAHNRDRAPTADQPYLLANELDENLIPPRTESPRVDLAAFLRRHANQSEPTADLLQDLRGFGGRHLLKSSKSALFVTRREYLQRDWCKTEPLVQKVKEAGCVARTVINRFCYGQCNSFYIPKNARRHRRRNGEEEEEAPAFKACAFCRPSKFTWVTVTLRCPALTPAFRKKRIQRIKQCKCTPANVD